MLTLVTSTIDPKIFNFTSSNVDVKQKKNRKGQTYYDVTMDLGFDNPSFFTLEATKVELSFWVYFKGEPVVNISTLPGSKMVLKSGRNHQRIKAVTKPEHAEELMELIGQISDGVRSTIVIKDIEFIGNSKWDKLQDMVDRLVIEYEIPPMDIDNSTK